MPQTTPLGVRIDQTLKDALDRAARDEMRSTASLVNKLLTDWSKAHGYLSADAADPATRRTGRPRSEATRADARITAGPIIPWVEQVIGNRTQITIGDVLDAAAPNSRTSAKAIAIALHGLGWTEHGGDGDAPQRDRKWVK